MANKAVTDVQAREALDAYTATGSIVEAGKILKVAPNTIKNRMIIARQRGLAPDPESLASVKVLATEVKSLETQLKAANKDRLDNAYVRETIFKIKNSEPKMPKWLVAPQKKSSKSPGVPITVWSDWHWGENVNPSEINGVNEFNKKIAHKRAETLFNKTIDLLKNYTVNPQYPGIVVNLGGDMVTGDIHEELTNTNDMPIMPTVIDLFGVLVRGLDAMADAFGNVFVPCVTGNHGRNTNKIQNKQRAFTSFDWLVYQLLEKHFENDPRITFFIPDSPDAMYRVHNHTYLLTHGDQFRGGDGIIGPLGPITRGNHKKRSRNSQIDMDYDTMIVGHFHQLMMLPSLIVNGSIKGYDEYAFNNNFGFEVPAQALWMNHETLGMTISMPVYMGSKTKKERKTDWVSIPEQGTY